LVGIFNTKYNYMWDSIKDIHITHEFMQRPKSVFSTTIAQQEQ